MIRARHYGEAVILAVVACQVLYGLQRLAVMVGRYRVNVDEITAKLAAMAGEDAETDALPGSRP